MSNLNAYVLVVEDRYAAVIIATSEEEALDKIKQSLIFKDNTVDASILDKIVVDSYAPLKDLTIGDILIEVYQ